MIFAAQMDGGTGLIYFDISTPSIGKDKGKQCFDFPKGRDLATS